METEQAKFIDLPLKGTRRLRAIFDARLKANAITLARARALAACNEDRCAKQFILTNACHLMAGKVHHFSVDEQLNLLQGIRRQNLQCTSALFKKFEKSSGSEECRKHD